MFRNYNKSWRKRVHNAKKERNLNPPLQRSSDGGEVSPQDRNFFGENSEPWTKADH
jgi:hypothetical protein